MTTTKVTLTTTEWQMIAFAGGVVIECASSNGAFVAIGQDAVALDGERGHHLNPGERIELDAQSSVFARASQETYPVDLIVSPVAAGNGNIVTKIRDACEVYPNPAVWDVELGEGDVIVSRGNTPGCGWIEISKSPWNQDTETVLGFVNVMEMPARVFGQVTMTHRNAGQQVASINFESEDELSGLEPMPEPDDVEILNASQTTNVITIGFNSPPAVPFRVGQVVSIKGFIDSRLNVANATVASVPSDTQLSLVGNDYAFISTNIGLTLGNGAAFIDRREMLGHARNAVAVVHGSATATQRRIHTRSQGGLSAPSVAAIAGAHAITTGSDVASAVAVAPRHDAWRATQEFNLLVSSDHVSYLDRAVDGNAAWIPRAHLTQLIPNPSRKYKGRARVRNAPSFNRIIGKIVSIRKAGSNTSTIELDRVHGLVPGQYTGFFGVRDQVNFPNHASGASLIVAATPTPSSIQVVHGGVASATSYGGFVCITNGQQPLGGAIFQVAQSVTRVNNIVTINLSATWAAPLAIGTLVEPIGLRADGTGADLLLDGVYNVINLAGSALTLEPVPGQAPTGPDIAPTNCGGGIVQRLGFRIHVLAALDYEPLLVEIAFKGNPVAGEALAIQFAGTQNVAVQFLPAGINDIGRVQPGIPATPFLLSSAASTNGNLVLTGSSGLTAIYATNSGASPAYLKLYNKATAPIVGTDVPAMTIPIPAAVGGVPGVTPPIPCGFGFRFPLGLGIAITAAFAATDTTAVAAGQVSIILSRTT